MRWTWTLILLGGCIPPSTLGLRSDGTIPAAGELEVLAGVGAGLCNGCNDHAGGGVQAALGVAPRLAIAAYVAAIPVTTPGAHRIGGAEARVALDDLDGEGLAGTLVVGFGGQSGYGDGWSYGGRLGLVGSVPVGNDLRPYLGVAWEPFVIPDGFRGAFVMAGGGLTWRPYLRERLRLLAQAEVVPVWFMGSDSSGRTGVGTGLAVGFTWDL